MVRARPRLTELLPREGQAGGVLIQVLVEVNAQVTESLFDRFDLLFKATNTKRKHSW